VEAAHVMMSRDRMPIIEVNNKVNEKLHTHSKPNSPMKLIFATDMEVKECAGKTFKKGEQAHEGIRPLLSK
jgi:hypothetical protein